MQKETVKKRNPIEKKTAPSKVKKGSTTQNYNFLFYGGQILIVLLGALIYSNSFQGSFHFDDFPNIVDNVRIQKISGLASWFEFNRNRWVAFYSFALNFKLGEGDIWGFHFVNLTIHLICSLLVTWLCYLLFSTPVVRDMPIVKHKKVMALVAGLLFVSHPLATQAITYIVQRMASLVAMFYLLSIVLYLKGRLTDGGYFKRAFWFAGALAAALLALQTKENSFTLPLAFLLLELSFFREKGFSFRIGDYRTWLVIAGLLALIVGIFSWYSMDIFKPLVARNGNSFVLTPLIYLFTQFSVLLKYIQLLIFPVNQMVDYDFPISQGFFTFRTAGSFLILLLLFATGVYFFKKNRLLAFGIFWFFLTMSVESSLVPIEDVIFEHRTYLPSVGYFLVLSLLVGRYWERHSYAILAGLGLTVVLFSIGTFQRNKVYLNELTLWTDNIEKAPGLARPLTNRGLAHKRAGNFDLALKDYDQALKNNPKYYIAYNNRGIVHAHFKNWEKAVEDYTKAIGMSTTYEEAYSNRGAAYASLKEYQKAIDDLTQAIAFSPGFADAYVNRGIILLEMGETKKAILDLSRSIQLKPKNPSYYMNRGVAFKKLKKYGLAFRDMESASLLDPGSLEPILQKAMILQEQNRTGDAIAMFSKALEQNPRSPQVLLNRGLLYAQEKNWEKALADFARVIEIQPNHPDAYLNQGAIKELQGKYREALADYETVLRLDPTHAIAQRNRAGVIRKIQNG